jgi:hypothetical protein
VRPPARNVQRSALPGARPGRERALEMVVRYEARAEEAFTDKHPSSAERALEARIAEAGAFLRQALSSPRFSTIRAKARATPT